MKSKLFLLGQRQPVDPHCPLLVGRSQVRGFKVLPSRVGSNSSAAVILDTATESEFHPNRPTTVTFTNLSCTGLLGTFNGQLPPRLRKRLVPSRARSRSSAFGRTRPTSWLGSTRTSRTGSMWRKTESGGTMDGKHNILLHFLSLGLLPPGMHRYPSCPSLFECDAPQTV